MQFGLTCFGRHLALEHFRKGSGQVIAMMDATEIEPHRQGVIRAVSERCQQLRVSPTSLAAIILDNYENDKPSHRILRELSTEFPKVPVINLLNIDDCSQIALALEPQAGTPRETLYLLSLTRNRIRQLVFAYLSDRSDLDDTLVTAKVISDLDALNIHRTPSNCLMILKLAEHAFDDSPVNRTEMIHRVLSVLFFQFNKIPRYATRPDLKDCEYALGYFCETLIRQGRSSFTKAEFFDKTNEYCSARLFSLDIEVLFGFLFAESIVVQKGHSFGFRFTYWLHFFGAHRMHHDRPFAEFILSEQRYSAFPELIEFYAGIDRRRVDAVTTLTSDLKEMNRAFLERTGIAGDFFPWDRFEWKPTEEAIAALRKELTESVEGSALPTSVKDAVADSGYDPSRPYNQELASFIEKSTLNQLLTAMRGAARVLRNSDHVPPEAKTALLEEVLTCWTRLSQLLAMLAPVLAIRGRAQFEDSFYVLQGFDDLDISDKLLSIVQSIAGNVVRWYKDDVFSKRIGPLLADYVTRHSREYGAFLVVSLMVIQRPPNWEKEVEKFIVHEDKNSYYLARILSDLRGEVRLGFPTERTRQELKRLAAMTLAKHTYGSKRPNNKMIANASKALEDDAKTKGRG